MALPALSQEKFQRAMAPLFAESKFTDYDFDRMSDLLFRLGKIEWSYRPRTYTVLRMIDRVELIDCFVNEGLKDIAFPFTAERLPNDLKDPLVQHSFLENQKLVLTKATDLEVSNGRHRHFGQDGDIYFDNLGLLGSGGFGVVHHVRSKLSRREYARKKIYRKRAFSGDKEAIRTLENELSHLKRLSHEHIVKLVGSYTDPKYVCLLIVPIADCNLEQFLNRQPFPDEDLDLLRGFFGCLSSAILYLHENKCRHKDIKPSNILLKSNTVYVADFGTARDSGNQTRSTTTGIPDSYTRLYAAPEVVYQGSRNSSTDIWSLGCVFLDMTTILNGETLKDKTAFFESCGTCLASPAENSDGLHDWFDLPRSKTCDLRPLKWIRRMLHKNPRVSSSNSTSSASLEGRPVAAEVLNQIRNSVGPYSYCGQCCRLEDDSPDGSYQGSTSDEEEVIPSKLEQGDRDEGAVAQSTLLNHGRDSKVASRLATSGKNGDSAIESTRVESGRSLTIRSARDGSERAIYLPSDDSDYEEAKYIQQRQDAIRLLEKGGFKFNFKHFKTNEAFLWAAMWGHDTAVSLLLENGADIEARDKNVWTALHGAASCGREAVVRLLLEKGADIDAKTYGGETALRLAAMQGHEAVVRLLSEREATINSKHDKEYTALQGAASSGHEAVVRLLLEQGAYINAEGGNGNMALHEAAAKGHQAVVRLLLENGATVDAKGNSGCTTLILAASNGHQAIVGLLLEKGADVNAKDINECTALGLAAVRGHDAVVELLLKEEVIIDAKNILGRTALHAAASWGYEVIVRLLLENGALVDTKDNNGYTALIIAALGGREAIVRLLLEKGAAINAKDQEGHTALIIAAVNDHKSIVQLLLRKGAKVTPENLRWFTATQRDPSIIKTETAILLESALESQTLHE